MTFVILARTSSTAFSSTGSYKDEGNYARVAGARILNDCALVIGEDVNASLSPSFWVHCSDMTDRSDCFFDSRHYGSSVIRETPSRDSSEPISPLAEPEVREAVESVEALEAKNNGRAASQLALRFIESKLGHHDIRAVNSFLLAINIDKLSPWALVSVVRSTARARSQLPAWKAAYDAGWRALVKLNRDPGRLYVGIVNDA